MLTKTARFIQKNSFWLVLFCHSLLLLSLSWQWAASVKLLQMKEEDKPGLFIPSYVAQNQTAPELEQPTPPVKSAPTPTSNLGIEKPASQFAPSSLNNRQAVNISRSPETEPVHLIGDKKINRPLLTLLGKALTKYLIYPKSALDLNVQGTSVIGFVLYPDGHVTDVQLLQTSRAEVLDKAALAAANAINPVNHVSQYLDKPKFMVIGIVFE